VMLGAGPRKTAVPDRAGRAPESLSFHSAEHSRVLREIQVQTEDVRGFRFEIRIVAGR
jgi:hypothetical protein